MKRDRFQDPSRREFLFRTGCAALGAAAVSAGIERFGLISALAQEAAPSDYRALVCIFLNGGNDGNNTLIPNDTTGYNAYSAARNASGLAIPQASLLPITPPSINMPFGLHPSLAELHGLWSQQKLAIVSNVGPLVQTLTRSQYQSGGPRPYQLFSHSDQIAQWATSRADAKVQTGWGGRTADFTVFLNGAATYPVVTSIAGTTVFAIGLSTRPLAIASATTPLNQVLVLNGFNTSAEAVARRNSMDFLRTIDTQATLIAGASEVMQQGIDISAMLNQNPALTTVFPATNLGNQLLQVAKVMKLNQISPAMSLNRQIFFCQLGGFDTHQNQVATHANLLTQLSQAMKAFHDATIELGIESRVTTFTLSDFGRTLQPAGTGSAVVGSDHAWGNHQFVLGGAVLGGEFYGVAGPNGTVYPTLQLSGPNDTDSRGRWIPTAAVEQYAATLATWFGLPAADLATVFPLLYRFSPPNLGFLA